MIAAQELTHELARRGATLFVGVPCSFLTPMIDSVIADRDLSYVGATSEGEAVGIAVGAWLAGATPVVMTQNSGLGNMVNPLATLVHPCRVAFPIISSWRGQPGLADAAQHRLMGRRSAALIEALEIGWAQMPAASAELPSALDRGWRDMQLRRLPFCWLTPKGTIRSGALREPPLPERPRGTVDVLGSTPRMPRMLALETVLEAVDPESAIVATTGMAGRELAALDDRPQHFYQGGAMGCASAIGLGVALGSPRPIVVLDGDGAALMKLGNLATIGLHAPPNLVHIVLDNGCHESTGGQRTASPLVDFGAIAVACGYASATTCDSPDTLLDSIRSAQRRSGPHLIRAAIVPGSAAGVGRPELPPDELARRFRGFVTEPLVTAGAVSAAGSPTAVPQVAP
jgi:phosphonopyruvate decarboxylase